MRPHATPRALGAGMALGALTLTSFVVDGGSSARAQAAAPDTPVADVAITGQRLNVVAGRRAVVRGHLAPAGAGRTVMLQRRSGDRWGTIDRATTTGDGAFRFTFRPRVTGSAPVRVRAGGTGEPVGRLNVYRHAHASWYGPGLFGSKLGCGGRLAPG
ncbi:MAG: rare lipoprotein, partial [Solirubrobacteraceae bacterium]|nr:rare lipoprotein [Solirubrobacteraceae bacterium]